MSLGRKAFFRGFQVFKNFEKNLYLGNLAPHFQKTMKFVKICKNHALPMAGGMFSIAPKPQIPVQASHTISLEMLQIHRNQLAFYRVSDLEQF